MTTNRTRHDTRPWHRATCPRIVVSPRPERWWRGVAGRQWRRRAAAGRRHDEGGGRRTYVTISATAHRQSPRQGRSISPPPPAVSRRAGRRRPRARLGQSLRAGLGLGVCRSRSLLSVCLFSLIYPCLSESLSVFLPLLLILLSHYPRPSVCLSYRFR